jgi:tripartite-type tricarboxylate transporter receptor subunit TctC
MRIPILLWHVGAITAIAGLIGWQILRANSQSAGSGYPERPIHIVVPYDAGGGSDTFVRILQKGISQDQLIDQPLVIINQPGGSGTIGSREVKNADPDGYKILCHHNAIITAQMAETVDYGPEAFEPIAMTGEMSMVILVRDDSPIKNIVDLLQAAKDKPNTIRFGANKGAPAYFTTLQLQKALAGAELSIVSAGGGADRYSKILGGHLEAGIFSLSEYLDFRGAEGTPADQNIRAIALLSNERHESIPNVPTTIELDIPVILTNANYWWAPKETPPAVLDFWADVLAKAMQNETVLAELARLRMDPTYDRDLPLKERLGDTIKQFSLVAEQEQSWLPNFTVYVGVVLLIFLAWAILETMLKKNRQDPAASPLPSEPFRKRPDIAIACFALLCGYVFLLSTGWLPFAIASAAMVALIGGQMMRGAPAKWIVLLELAVLTGLGSQFIFTEIFITPLP